MNRRGFLFGAGTAGLLIAAPSIVRAANLMPVKAIAQEFTLTITGPVTITLPPASGDWVPGRFTIANWGTEYLTVNGYRVFPGETLSYPVACFEHASSH